MRKVTIAQALKQRKRMESRLQQYRSLIHEQNCLLEGSKRPIDIRVLSKNCGDLEEKLLKLRTQVAVANGKVSGKLIEMALLKDQLKFLTRLPCDESSIEQIGEDKLLRKEAVIGAQEVFEKSEGLTGRINVLQDELDQFNATETILLED